jgi:hypothetical protein
LSTVTVSLAHRENRMRTGLIGVVCSPCALCLSLDAAAEPTLPTFSPAVEAFTILPTLGGLDAFATAISEAGHVAGHAATLDGTPTTRGDRD